MYVETVEVSGTFKRKSTKVQKNILSNENFEF